MLENRAFDHMLGWLHELRPEVDGLTGNEFNPVNPYQPNSEKVYVNKNADYIIRSPGHTVQETFEQASEG